MDDNIAVARLALPQGHAFITGGQTLVTVDAIPMGHKVALRRIGPGEMIHRYGQAIGRARIEILPGQHVHTQNLAFEELHFNYEFPSEERPLAPLAKDIPTFLGYPREDGRAGTRNYIAVVAASNCAAHTAELIAASFAGETLPDNIDGIAVFPHGDGCGHTIGPDTDQLQRTLAGVMHHPNVGAAVILGLGCEVNQIEHYLGPNAPKSGRLVGMTLQETGGTRATVDASRKAIRELMEQL